MKIRAKATPDVLVRNEGTVFLFCPLTPQAKEWIDVHVQSDAQWFGNALAVEHRYAWGLAEVMKDEGLVLARLHAEKLHQRYPSSAESCGCRIVLLWLDKTSAA
jgi:hypothetical protein